MPSRSRGGRRPFIAGSALTLLAGLVGLIASFAGVVAIGILIVGFVFNTVL